MNTIEIQQMMNEQQTEQKMNELEQMLLLIFSLLFLNLTSRLVPRDSRQHYKSSLNYWRPFGQKKALSLIQGI